MRKKKPAAAATAAAAADDGKPKRFWDGFQWVDTDTRTVANQQGTVGQATRKDRRLYVGNLPLGAGLTEKQLSEFIATSMAQRQMLPAGITDPVLSVWLSPEGTYAFVEFHSVDFANAALGLNGLNLLTSALRISRPNNYQPTCTVMGGLDTLMGGPVPSAVSMPAAITSLLGGAVPSQPEAQVAPAALAIPALTTTVLTCKNMLTKDDLNDDVEREGLKEDVGDECKKFGTLESIKIPLTGNDDCCIYVKFATVEAAGKAFKSLSGRKFDGRVVEVTPMSEADFAGLQDGQ